MDLKQRITEYSLGHYKLITIVMVVFTLVLGALISFIKVDTDPENMLSPDEPVRLFHNQTKERFTLSDIVVMGIVNNKDPNGVFNPSSLAKIYELAEFAKTLRWEDASNPNEQIGVIEVDLLAPSTVDHIGQGSPGTVTFEWLMNKPPATQAKALEIKEKAMSNPMLKGTLFAESGKAICLYLPLTSKDLSHRVYKALNAEIAKFNGDEEYHITGLPVAEDTFGVEMFIQMAISAPLAMIVIFILMLLFFRKLVLVISPMIVAMVSVISTMGLLIGFGYPVHIMSSMIPIFLMPIAVVDSVHILSEFFDLYTKEKGRKKTTIEVMDDLFMPMLYTSLTSAAGFASLALTPIPPVQVFGIFVAIGIMIAWISTITFVPAYIMMIKESSLENFGSANVKVKKQSFLEKLLHAGGRFTYSVSKPILVIMLIITAIAIYGITRIQINDNPVKWFSTSHPIRQADIELNKHFGGTYMAYLVLEPAEPNTIGPKFISEIRKHLSEKSLELRKEFPGIIKIVPELEETLLEQASSVKTKEDLLVQMSSFIDNKLDTADANDIDMWYELSDFFELEKERLKIFKQPDVLRYISALQEYLVEAGLIGKSSSVADVVKKVHQELIDGREENYKIPDSSPAVAQCLLQFQSSHNPEDLWHMVTMDYMYANIWIQLPSGDNKDMEKVVRAVDLFMAPKPADITSEYEKNKDLEKYVKITAKSQNGKTDFKKIKLSGNEFKDYEHILTTAMSMTKDAAVAWNFKYADQKYAQSLVHKIIEFSVNSPEALKHDWAGLTYINTVWQDKMVSGMLQSFLGSFIIVFIMMSILFRSPLWGIVCMVPLLITIIIIYGIIGLIGKDYDMPVAVLSALTLGMAVDFAIHFLERARSSYAVTCSWKKSAAEMFGEPARAITRNVLVIAIGFLPLLAAPLIPYKTVGIFLCAIMALSGAVTLLALPSIIKLAEKLLFKPIHEPKSVSCNCAFCIIISIASVALIALNIHQYGKFGLSKLIILSVIIITAMALACGIISRRRACKMAQVQDKENKQN